MARTHVSADHEPNRSRSNCDGAWPSCEILGPGFSEGAEDHPRRRVTYRPTSSLMRCSTAVIIGNVSNAVHSLANLNEAPATA